MKASELRIGNFFLLNGQVAEVGWATIMEIDRKEKGLLVTYHGLPPKHEPIPLTEEWLIKFGFQHLVIGRMWVKCTQDKEHEYQLAHQSDGSWMMYFHRKNIYYVHQLQNLFFALTGEELTVKES